MTDVSTTTMIVHQDNDGDDVDVNNDNNDNDDNNDNIDDNKGKRNDGSNSNE